MISYTGLLSQFQTLSQNTSSSNSSLASLLINQTYRYLLLRFFDNERQFTITTIGPQTLTLTTSTLAAGSTSATLTAAWTYLSCHQYVVFGDGEQRTVYFTQGSTAITWQSATTTIQTSASITCVGVQSYPLPANVSKLKNSTITVGQLVYTPAPVQTIQEWTRLNALPYTSEIPAYFFIYGGELNFWPIPSATGDIITLNAQATVPDMTYADNTTGTIATISAGSNAITGSGTTFATGSSIPTGVDLTFYNIFFVPTQPKGDGIPYQVSSITSDTALTLAKPIVHSIATGGTLLLGQYPLLDPNFHDAILYGALKIYFSSISENPTKAAEFGSIYEEKLKQMEFYLSTKQVNVDLGDQPIPRNPNLFTFAK